MEDGGSRMEDGGVALTMMPSWRRACCVSWPQVVRALVGRGPPGATRGARGALVLWLASFWCRLEGNIYRLQVPQHLGMQLGGRQLLG